MPNSNIEMRFVEFFQSFRDKITITINDFEALESELLNRTEKLQRQRERLESSRDMWKSRYLQLKKRTKK